MRQFIYLQFDVAVCIIWRINLIKAEKFQRVSVRSKRLWHSFGLILVSSFFPPFFFYENICTQFANVILSLSLYVNVFTCIAAAAAKIGLKCSQKFRHARRDLRF